jgi:hypothetical protein
VASRREVLLGVRMNSSRPEGGDDGGEGSTLRRLTVAVVFRGLRSGGAGLASHGNVRGIWVCDFGMGSGSEGDALSGECFVMEGGVK